MKLNEVFLNATKEQKAKLLKCNSAEKLLQVAETEGMEISAEEATELFEGKLDTAAELGDDELGKVSGGAGAGACCMVCGTAENVGKADGLVSNSMMRLSGNENAGVCKSCANFFFL